MSELMTYLRLARIHSFQRLAVSSVWIKFHVALRERVELTHPRALTTVVVG